MKTIFAAPSVAYKNKCFVSSCYMSITGYRGAEFVVVTWGPRLMNQTLSHTYPLRDKEGKKELWKA